jgi:hypothetical protein
VVAATALLAQLALQAQMVPKVPLVQTSPLR